MSLSENPEFVDKTFWQNFKSTLSWDYPLVTNSFLVYWLMIIIMFGLNFYKKFKNQYIQNLELESQLTQSELQTLKMQLQPHFLFNALNTISMMVRRKKGDQAVVMISGLSDLLRTTLTRQSDQFVTLKEELELIRKYLEIEQNRFKDNIKVVYEIDAKLNKYQCPISYCNL
jgi:LytS/YehU family sensor histidine kinase